MSDATPPTRSKRSSATRAQRILASLIAGAGVDDIGAAERLTRKRTESILRQELRNRWVAPTEDFARLQIARLEQMILKLLTGFRTATSMRSTARSRSSTGSTAITDSPRRSAPPNSMTKRIARGSSGRSMRSRTGFSLSNPRNEQRRGATRPGAARRACAPSSRSGRQGQARLRFSEPQTRHTRAPVRGNDAARMRAIVP